MEILNNFGILTLKQIFWKVKIFLKKLGYHFLVESTKIENVSLLYKTAISEANVITDRMVCTKWTYHKEWSHASNNFIFLNIFFSLRTSWFDILTSQMSIFVQMSIFILFVSAGVWLCFFPVSILQKFCDPRRKASVLSHFFNKAAGLKVCNFIKKDTPPQLFSC